VTHKILLFTEPFAEQGRWQMGAWGKRKDGRMKAALATLDSQDSPQHTESKPRRKPARTLLQSMEGTVVGEP
jgi:hypothetical protein